MSEEEFQQQEAQRQEAEKRKRAVQEGIPLPGTVEEFLQMLQNQVNRNPTLEEYIKREHMQNKAVMEAWREGYERRILEQGTVVNGLMAEVLEIRRKLAELEDNFNLLANKIIAQGERRNELISRAVLTLETELKR